MYANFLQFVDADGITITDIERRARQTADAVGTMTAGIYSLTEASDGGTDRVGLHEGLPVGVRAEDNELGWSISIDKLARLVEAGL